MAQFSATHLASQGAILSLADNNASLLDSLAQELTSLQGVTGKLHKQVVDVRDGAAVNSWIRQTIDKLGPLDGAANLAAVVGKQQNVATIADIDDQDWDLVLGVNLGGIKNSLRAEIPALKDGSSVVNVSSVAGVVGFKMGGAYVASKHAVIGLTKVAAKEL